MSYLHTASSSLSAVVAGWLAGHSVGLLRMSMGLVFLTFGVLKFFPGLSPAEELAQATVAELTFGLVPANLGILLVAALESTIGFCLLTGRYLRLGLALLGLAMVGILSPLVLLPEDLFRGDALAPTLEGQYVLKDLVLLCSALVIAAGELGVRMVAERDGSARAPGSVAGAGRPRQSDLPVGESQHRPGWA